MRKRIIPLLAALCLLLCLLPSAALAAETDGTVDQSRSYNFVLTAEKGQTEVQATTGEVITVTLVLKRTDSAESADMYGMQTEIEYDDTFLQLVEGSVMTASGVRWNDLGRRTGGRIAADPHQHAGIHPGRHGRVCGAGQFRVRHRHHGLHRHL